MEATKEQKQALIAQLNRVSHYNAAELDYHREHGKRMRAKADLTLMLKDLLGQGLDPLDMAEGESFLYDLVLAIQHIKEGRK